MTEYLIQRAPAKSLRTGSHSVTDAQRRALGLSVEPKDPDVQRKALGLSTVKGTLPPPKMTHARHRR